MQHELFMHRCLDLAKKGQGLVSPNPMVGCVIVHENKILSEGYHQQFGQAHAEVNAIKKVRDQNLLKTSTLYVNLEPCAHHGKTPPCANLIVEMGIPKVVIGCIDSYSEVSGKGIKMLQDAGIEVQVGILEKESLKLNKRFFTFHTKGRPYVILKWAQSKNGFIDTQRLPNEKGQFQISGTETRQLVHYWRHQEAGILIGKNTLITDNPSLTVRDIDGKSPTRFVLDERDEINISEYQLGDESAKTYKITGTACTSAKNILNFIAAKKIDSLIVEGGKKTLKTFIDAKLWDEARILIGPENIKKGTTAPILDKKPHKSCSVGLDQIEYYRND